MSNLAVQAAATAWRSWTAVDRRRMQPCSTSGLPGLPTAGTGTLEAPTTACLCYGGLVTDAAGNKLRKHGLPAAV